MVLSIRTEIHGKGGDKTNGFHPTLRTTVKIAPQEEEEGGGGGEEEELIGGGCGLMLVYEFPSSVILDEYELRGLYSEGRLSDPPAAPISCGSQQEEEDLFRVSDGVHLEAPASPHQSPPSLLIPITTRSQHAFLVPLHLRYLPPVNQHTHSSPVRHITIQPPRLLKWCSQTNNNLPSRFNLTDFSPTTKRLIHQTFSSPNRTQPRFQTLTVITPSSHHHLDNVPLQISVPVGYQQDEFLHACQKETKLKQLISLPFLMYV
ncbi:hypothetical protein PCASD_01273 [Puccinia coronata f. sp. avenae]|uniref:Protein PBN1 n=1 Tax=Puccinia coronata f. sp. avenae TaxID=200324 RepID=A0A2N5VJ52_9BASI|nr:hypothetical protein PCASD_22981 [Puccinia coronata f. sp. avenae]PLW50028.1 hypothetical protein PCASD_01273 [Puccinia coronata f. sp. avenae]